jgi:thymidylate synthase ThyX
MEFNYKFDADLGIASILSDSDWQNINVHVLMQNPLKKQPSINAYLGARYSRSADSIASIAKEISKAGIDASSRLEAIFQGYGHKSVGDMADIFVCIENVPMLSAMKAFNLNPVLAGQERSTRFQNFNKPDYINLPKDIGIPEEIRSLYDEIIHEHMSNYRDLLPETEKQLQHHFTLDSDDKRDMSALKARSFDTARYFIPLGVKTSLGFVMSARNWSEYISRLAGSSYLVDKHLADLLTKLLVGTDDFIKLGYTPEADGLIRHTEANSTRDESIEAAKVQLNNKITKKNRGFSKNLGDDCSISSSCDPVNQVLEHLILASNPNLEVKDIEFTNVDRSKIGSILAKYHHHYNQIGNLAQTGAYQIDGYADHGVLKDLNRHRSMERYIPLWETYTDIEAELKRDEDNMNYLCDYLEIPELAQLKTSYQGRFTKTYTKIKRWIEISKGVVDKNILNEFGRYLLPHAHATRYRFYGSVDDMQYTINLRTRPGGHIAYRKLTDEWLNKLVETDSFWKGFRINVPKVDADDKAQFLNRS